MKKSNFKKIEKKSEIDKESSRTLVFIDPMLKIKAKAKAGLLNLTFEQYINRLIEINTKDISIGV